MLKERRKTGRGGKEDYRSFNINSNNDCKL